MNIFSYKKGEWGFFKTIVLVILGILILAYFGVDLSRMPPKENLPGWLISTLDIIKNIWQGYLEPLFRSLKKMFEN